MARFQYQARDNQGELASGMVAASSLEEASRLLRGEGKFIVKLSEVGDEQGDDAGFSSVNYASRVKRQDVIFFAQQLAVMVETGVPITDALESIVEQASNPNFKQVVRDVATEVQSGTEFSVALKAFPAVFPSVMVSLIRAAEASGTLGPMLQRISEYMGKELRTAKQVKGALTYPAIMICMTIGVTIFLLTFVLPKFAGIYSSRGQSLPGPTQLLLDMSSLLVDHWQWWIIGVVATVATLVMFSRSQQGKRSFDWMKLNMPMFKNMFTLLYITRSTRTLGTMINAGVPMLDAVQITRDVTNNSYFEELWAEVDDNLRQGLQLSDPLFASQLMPRSIVQMIRSGEKSGRLGQVLSRVAEHTEEEFDNAVKAATQYIEPVMVTVMGGIIGFVAISLLLPIFTVGKAVAG